MMLVGRVLFRTCSREGKGGVLATKAVETHGKCGVLATNAEEAQGKGKGSVFASKAVKPHSKGTSSDDKGAPETRG